MTPSQDSESPLSAWQSASADARFIGVDNCASRASKFELKVRIRNAIEYGAGAFVFVLFSAAAIGAVVKDEMFIALSMAMIVAGIIVTLWGVRMRASNLERRPEDPCVAHLRRQYQRQFEALNSVPLWYIGPMVPGIAVFLFAVTYRVAQVADWSIAIGGIMGPAAIVFGIFGFVILLNWIVARSIKRKIDAIDALA